MFIEKTRLFGKIFVSGFVVLHLTHSGQFAKQRLASADLCVDYFILKLG